MTSLLRLRHLEVFLAVAQAGSMQRASQTAHLTQPAISKIVRELETTFGVSLLARSKRGVSLTECGQALVDRARGILNDIATIAEDLSAIERGAVGKVHVGALPVVEAAILPNTLLALRKSAPGLSVQIEEGTRAGLLNALRRGEVDCVVGRLDAAGEAPDLHVEKLIRTPVMIVTRPSHPLARHGRVTWRALADYPWVLPPVTAPIRAVIDGEFIRAGERPPVPLIESTSSRLNYAIVRDTDMVTVMTADAARSHVGSGTLAILPIALTDPLPFVGIVTRSGRISRALTTFLEALRAQCRMESKRLVPSLSARPRSPPAPSGPRSSPASSKARRRRSS